ncbi:MgtC/SapB family protein [Prevotella dentasini]|uniref:MgtC/SapB family protein n=1 Tax=Prevotella dentasini TaxID=589537 RepID=UPI0004697C5F|nr:MgtC/SapB family protein [Prevotella dentasini]
MDVIVENSLRLVVALLLGGIIGLEREFRAKDAGFRTHFLVALGAALFTIISQYGFGDGVKDTSRVAAQVVSGIGFLGAGLIVFQKNVVRGLTTAAGLWVTAAVGMACGVGMYWTACLVTALVLAGLEIVSKFVPKLGTMLLQLSFSSPSRDSVRQVVDKIRKDSMEINSYELRERRTSNGELFEVHMDIKVRKSDQKDRLMEYMQDFDDVLFSNIE